MARKSIQTINDEMKKKLKGASKGLFLNEDSEKYMVVPTDSPQINNVIGNGGIVLGKMYGAKGTESGGKSAVGAGVFMSAIQKNICHANKRDAEGDLITEGRICLVDAEHSYNKGYWETMGVKTDSENLQVIVPENGEQGLDLLEDLVKSGLYDGIMVDSISALIPQAWQEQNLDENGAMGAQSRLISKSFPRLLTLIDEHKVGFYSISQIRNKIGIMFGSPETTAGGNAWKFYNHVILRVSRTEFIGSEEEPTGIEIKVKADKNKLAPPKRVGMTSLDFSSGFDFDKEYLVFAVKLGFIDKAGSWYSYKDQKLGQGKINATEAMVKHSDWETIKSNVDKTLAGTLGQKKEPEMSKEDEALANKMRAKSKAKTKKQKEAEQEIVIADE